MHERWGSGRISAAWGIAVAAVLLLNGSEARAIDVVGTSATFEWTAASGPVTGYSVLVSRNDGAYQQETTTSAGVRQVTVSGDVGESLRVRVAAFDGQGTTGPQSLRSSSVTFVTQNNDPPPAPGGGGTAGQLNGLFNDPVIGVGLAGDARLFVAERAGRIRILENGSILPGSLLDIRSRVGTAGEGGLLGLALDPDCAHNGLFYVLYTDNSGDLVLSRFQLTADANVAERNSEEVLLTVDPPSSTRLAGSIAFSPVDGYLYVALGDGDGPGDPGDLAQDGGSLLGKMLRLDVSGGAGTPYDIPRNNPFVGNPGMLDEIWALGLGDPERFAFDWQTGDLWIGDVGPGLRQEINYERAGDGGNNYGWDVMEGTECNADDPAPAPPCDDPSFTDPIHEYDHLDGDCAVVGGAVYRGPLAAYEGLYLFGDSCSGRLFSLDPQNGDVVDRSDEFAPAGGAPLDLVAIAEDGYGALYALHRSGRVVRIGPTGNECADGIDNDGDGSTDGADPGCDSVFDASEHDSDLVCDDGFDNDRDGRIDFPADNTCASATAAFEESFADTVSEQVAGDGGGGGGGCGVGIELVVVLPPLMWLYERRRRRRFAA